MHSWWSAVSVLLVASASAWGQPSTDAGVVVPPVLVRPSAAPWPAGAADGGEVELRLTVDELGQVKDIEVTSSPGEPFTSAAVDAAHGLGFEPATQDGRPVAVVLGYRYRFEAPPPPAEAPDAGPAVAVALLRGRVLTKGTREPIALAQLYLGEAPTPLGETDGEGRFSVQVPPAWRQAIRVTAPQHRAQVFKEQLEAGQQVEVVYRLARTEPRPYETIVRGQADRAELSRVTLSGAELHDVAGTNGEPLRVVMLLPGVVTPASGINYPVVRGSLPAATGFFLDGVRVPQLYHLLLGSSVVQSDFIESIDFYPANAPTRFGRVSGGVISAQVAKARDDRVHVTVQPDLLQTGAFVEVPLPQTGTNVTLGGHVNYTAWLLGLLSSAGAFGQGVKPVYEAYDYQARVEQKAGPVALRLLAFGSSDVVGTRQDDPNPSVFLTSRFHRIDLKGSMALGPGQLELGTTLGWETMGLYGEVGTKRVGTFLFDRFSWQARALYRWVVDEHWQLKAGVDFERQASAVETTNAIGPQADLLTQPTVLGTFTGTFVEAAWTQGAWTLVGGLRVDSWHKNPDVTLASVDPRLDLRFAASPAVTLRASAGLAHQAPMLLISLPVTDAGALGTGLQEVGELSLGATGLLPWLGLELSGEVFYNHLFQVRERSLAEFVSGVSSLDDRFSGNRWGRAYGLELMLRLPQQGRLFGWLSYTLMRSERLRHFALYSADQTTVSEATAMVPFAFDQTHSLNLALGYQLPLGFKVAATFHFNTGRPESGEFSSRTARVVTDPTTGRQAWSLLPLDQVARLPPFARLDLRVSKAISYNDFQLELYLDVFNVSVSTEVYGYTYSSDSNGVPTKTSQGAPIILPTLGVKVVY